MLAVVEVGDPRLIAIGDLTGQGVVALHERACSAQALGDSVHGLMQRLKNAGFGYLLKPHLLRGLA